MAEARFDAVVIGAGLNGLTAAAALARAGRRVVVLEASDAVGGQAQVFEFAPGFRAPLHADTGWLPERVAKGLGLNVASVAPEISVSIAHDGAFRSLPTNTAQAANVIREHSSLDAGAWAAFTQRLVKLSGFLGALYQAPPPDVDLAELSDFTALLGLGRKFRALGREDMTELLRVLPMSVQDFLEDEFETPWLRAAVGAGGVRDIRQGPRSGGTSFVLIHYLLGAPLGSVRMRSWWRDGPDACVTAVEAAARTAGVTIRTNAPVSRINVDNDAVTGVALANGDEIAAPIVVSTTDPASTLLGVDPVWLDPDLIRAVQNIKFRACTAIIQFAVDRLPNGISAAALASIATLSPNLDSIERAYDAAKYGLVSAEPHIEITSPSVRWPSLAPAGKHVVTAHVQYVPRQPRDGAWTDARSRDLADLVTARIARALPGFAESVLHRAVFAPSDLEARFGLTDGALTHGELTLDQILFMRPIPGLARYSTDVDGLYLGGAGSHPGPGVVGGAGWLAARAALSQRAKQS
ncbi:MAG TPA: NAD(P)/FAD-dependent oxidoreductase [Gemmatimonadaceae bacterium]|nr:NAD(P)/FAD-dependent oxidoreductase [Gemmatimonadaceae bacterium]